jgi:hypothetical protein
MSARLTPKKLIPLGMIIALLAVLAGIVRSQSPSGGYSSNNVGPASFSIINQTPTTVTGLGAAAAGNKGFMRVVSDSTAIAAEGQTCAGSSTHTALAFSDGTTWKCF